MQVREAHLQRCGSGDGKSCETEIKIADMGLRVPHSEQRNVSFDDTRRIVKVQSDAERRAKGRADIIGTSGLID